MGASVVSNICRLSRLLFNITSDEGLLPLFGLSKSAIELTLHKIISPWPDNFLTSLSPEQCRELENILAKEFIFFQVQEKESANYSTNLAHFIRILQRDLQKKFKFKMPQSRVNER